MKMFLQIVAFSLQSERSGRPDLTKRKRPRIVGLENNHMGIQHEEKL